MDKAASLLQREQLCDRALWAKFVNVYRVQPDGENQGWRGEFWGKMMRGGALVYEYTRDGELYSVLTESVKDMMSVAEADGRVSSYSRRTEFDSWDLWSRKYVLLGCEYYLDICRDEVLKEQIVAFLCRAADYIMLHIGPDKKRITQASRSWFGLNSSSILEPVVRLYRLTGKQSYLDFASYIVTEGGAEGINIFELAYENKIYPYQYGVSKAYEMTSCFEGLLEYYKATGIEKYKTAVINFADALLRSEVSVIGSCGVTHELLDHTRVRQTARHDGVMQETCVTVTWMKFCASLLTLTGDSRYADAMERSFYNAYLGALNTEHKESAHVLNKRASEGVVSTYLPFDSYSPLTPGRRGREVGGDQLLPDKTYYGCCACIGSAGVGVFAKNAVTVDGTGITVNFFEAGRVETEYRGVKVKLSIETSYPADGDVRITVRTERPVELALRLRNPAWADMPAGYTEHRRIWHEDTVSLHFEMPIRIHRPEHWTEDLVYTDTSAGTPGYHCAGPVRVFHEDRDDRFFAVTRGPLVLAADSRTGKRADSVFAASYEASDCEPRITENTPCLLKLRFAPKDSEEYFLVDYASAGHDWETTIAAWLPTE